MIGELSNLDFGNERKSRRSLVIASVFLIFTSNLTLGNNTLTLFGLEFLLSQVALESLARVLVYLSLISFIFALSEVAPKRITRMMRIWDERWWRPRQKEIDDMYHDQDPNRDYSYEAFRQDNPDWEDKLYKEKSDRKKRRIWVANLYRPIVILTRTLSTVLWPIFLAVIALSHPEFVLTFVEK